MAKFKKGGKIYGIDHPVWNHENEKKASVNIYNKLSSRNTSCPLSHLNFSIIKQHIRQLVTIFA